jgi:HSF-type DNA-binding
MMLLMMHIDKLHELMSIGKGPGLPPPIDWCTRNSGEDSDNVIVITDGDRLVKETLPTFGFQVISAKSFARKLFRWGFRQVSEFYACKMASLESRSALKFESEHFRKGDFERLSNMRSMTAPNTRKSITPSQTLANSRDDDKVMSCSSMRKKRENHAKNLKAVSKVKRPRREAVKLGHSQSVATTEALYHQSSNRPASFQGHVRQHATVLPQENNSSCAKKEYVGESLSDTTTSSGGDATQQTLMQNAKNSSIASVSAGAVFPHGCTSTMIIPWSPLETAFRQSVGVSKVAMLPTAENRVRDAGHYVRGGKSFPVDTCNADRVERQYAPWLLAANSRVFSETWSLQQGVQETITPDAAAAQIALSLAGTARGTNFCRGITLVESADQQISRRLVELLQAERRLAAMKERFQVSQETGKSNAPANSHTRELPTTFGIGSHWAVK